MKKTLLRGARVVRLDDVTENTDVLIEDGRIARIGESLNDEASQSDTEDLHGLTLFPGFIDVHIHGAVGVDTMEATPTGLLQVAEFLATQGVTAWLPTLVPSPQPQYQHAVESISEVYAQQRNQDGKLPPRARVLGLHYEGPFVNAELCGALHSTEFRTYASPVDLDQLPVIREAGALHMMTLAPEIDGGIELISELRKRAWTASIGHTRAGLDQLDQACEAGASHLTHFMNAMPPLHHRSPGPVGWGLTRDDVTCDFIADGIHIDPAMLRLLVKLKSPARLNLISDSIAAAGMGDGEYKIWDETIEVKEGRTRNAHGSIAGSVITMLDAVRMMRGLGVSDVDVARMASANPARLLGIESDCGTIEVGKRADLVALDEHGEVVLTLIEGQASHGFKQERD